jgi:hypothetical protein
MNDGTLEITREHLPYQVEKVLVTAWMPILGPDGFAIYNFYRCLADDGRAASPSLRMTSRHTHTSKTIVLLNNRLLRWTGLIRKISGDQAQSNSYLIRKVPVVTADLLAEIRQKATADAFTGKHPWWLRRQSKRAPAGLLDRIDAWKPWRPIPAVSPQMFPNGEAVTRQPQPVDPELADRLARFGFDGAARWLSDQSAKLVKEWLDFMDTHPDYRKGLNNAPGLLRRRVENGERPPLGAAGRDVCPDCGRETINGDCLYCMGLVQA